MAQDGSSETSARSDEKSANGAEPTSAAPPPAHAKDDVKEGLRKAVAAANQTPGKKAAPAAKKKAAVAKPKAAPAAASDKTPAKKAAKIATPKTAKKAAKKAAAKKAPARKKAPAKKAAPAQKSTQKPTQKSVQKPKPRPAARAVAPDAVAREAAAKLAAAAPNGARKDDDSARAKPIIEDFDSLSEYLVEITGKIQDVIREFFVHHPELQVVKGDASPDPLNLADAAKEMMNSLAADPGTVMERQFRLWGDFAKLMGVMSRRWAGEDVEPAVEPAPGDKRFRHAAWSDNPMLDFVKQSYLTYANWLNETVDQLDGMNDYEKKRATFYTKQFVDAIAPSNFAMLNPEVVEATIESKGENLLKGLKNLLEDLDRGHGALSIRQADLDHFKLGENVATTPGKVVFQNDIMQVIQYDPTTLDVGRRPLLIFPPWINKFYILDLQPENSFIKWMVDQGRTVFLVSWVNPGPELKDKTFIDYIHEGLFEALGATKAATGEDDVDAIGYCIGGTMLSTALSLMAKRGDDRIKTATFFTAQADFSEAGDLLLFVDDTQLDAIEKQMDAAGGVLEGRAMATTFNMLRSNDLIWSFVIDNYMKGKDPAKFDLLYWNSDSTRMPKGVHLFYLREFYQKNRLASGTMVVDGETLDLGAVDIPIFMQAGETDHIAPPNSIYKTARSFGGENVQYMLAGSGHIAGVVNHPRKKKYHHSVNTALPDTLGAWKENAERHPGSWWAHWMGWLNENSPGRVPARTPGDGALDPIEDAPGSYVKVKS
ncbi:MAG: class I poly(R)-hydroxyalkanoic acid synthase [Pseudomonadota bacterium]